MVGGAHQALARSLVSASAAYEPLMTAHFPVGLGDKPCSNQLAPLHPQPQNTYLQTR